MQIEIIGVVAVVLGIWGLLKGSETVVTLLCISAVFGASAAVKLPALGDASVPPSHFLLLFLTLQCLRDKNVRAHLLTTLSFPRAGFWLTFTVAYGVVTAYFMPRLFSTETLIYYISRGPGQDLPVTTVSVQPLAFRAGNVTQSVYFIGNLICFALVATLASIGSARQIALALTSAAVLHIILAIVDLGSHAVGLGDILSVVRNANYRILADTQLNGIKRVVGGFSEAGAYAYVAIGFYAFSLDLWLQNIRPKLYGALALLLGALLIMSTSTTAYLAFVIFNILAYLGCLRRMHSSSRRNLLFLAAGPLTIGLFVLGLMLLPSVWNVVTELYDETFTRKLTSESGVQRARWNAYAIQSFWDTAGFGAGLGSVRTSSFLVAMISNVGTIGTSLYCMYLLCVVKPNGPAASNDDVSAIRRASRAACIAILIAACITLGSLDLGIFFTVFAGLSTSARSAPRAYPVPPSVLQSRPAP